MRIAVVVALVLLGGWLVVGALVQPGRGVAAPAAAFVRADVAAEPPARSAPQPVETPDGPSDAGVRGGDARLVDAAWAASTSAQTGIPLAALVGYAGAALALDVEQTACNLSWTTLAALGDVESAHGTHAGSSIGADGSARPPIYGPALDGGAYANMPDSDGGAVDGSSGGDRAVGPLQFIPSTWQNWGADGDGDGRADPQQIDDAALAAGRYLCSYGDLSSPVTWRASVFAYNHVESYVDLVASTANQYAREAA